VPELHHDSLIARMGEHLDRFYWPNRIRILKSVYAFVVTLGSLGLFATLVGSYIDTVVRNQGECGDKLGMLPSIFYFVALGMTMGEFALTMTTAIFNESIGELMTVVFPRRLR